MFRNVFRVIVLGTFVGFALAADRPAATRKPAEPPEAIDNIDTKKIDPDHIALLKKTLGGTGESRADGHVFVLTLPRTDLDLHSIDFGDVPVEAGVETSLRFFRCGCGKYYVLGEFCVTDYESADVIDSLVRGQMRIASVAPMMLGDKPRIVLIRFQAEGEIDALNKTLADAMRWVGENRSKPQPAK